MENKISINGELSDFSFKDITQREIFELDRYYRKIFGECIKLGLMTEKQAARLYEKNGSWCKEQEQEVARLAMELNDLSEKIKTFDKFNDESKEVMAKMITARADLTSLIGEKMELFRQTAEGTANQERVFLYIRVATVDENGKNVFDTNEDLEKYSFDNPDDFGKILTAAYLAQHGFDKDRDLTDDWEEILFLNRAHELEEKEEAKVLTKKKVIKPRKPRTSNKK